MAPSRLKVQVKKTFYFHFFSPLTRCLESSAHWEVDEKVDATVHLDGELFKTEIWKIWSHDYSLRRKLTNKIYDTIVFSEAEQLLNELNHDFLDVIPFADQGRKSFTVRLRWLTPINMLKYSSSIIFILNTRFFIKNEKRMAGSDGHMVTSI